VSTTLSARLAGESRAARSAESEVRHRLARQHTIEALHQRDTGDWTRALPSLVEALRIGKGSRARPAQPRALRHDLPA